MKLLFSSPVIRTSPLHSSISSLRRCDTLEDLSLELDDSSSSDGDQEAEYVFPVIEEVCLTTVMGSMCTKHIGYYTKYLLLDNYSSNLFIFKHELFVIHCFIINEKCK